MSELGQSVELLKTTAESANLPPFLKWAGGKRWLVDSREDLFEVPHNRFVEPFLGSGAVFFHLQPESAILSDQNGDLINAYNAIKTSWRKVAEHLARHQKKHDKEYYYKIRSSCPRSLEGKAAKFIYLNRTCWNGLYRVNLKGRFNVPIGTKNSVLLQSDNFEGVATALKNVELLKADFEETIDATSQGDFVFIDPPYTVQHNHNGFVKYNERLFSWEDQIRLRDSIVRSIGRGAKILLTNAAHDCVLDLYEGIGEVITLSRNSVISGKVIGRGQFDEVAIKCY